MKQRLVFVRALKCGAAAVSVKTTRTLMFLAVLPLLALGAGEDETAVLRDYPRAAQINPLIGAVTFTDDMKGSESGHGLGKTFPGAATPFGMVQLSPDTITGGDHGPGYSYSHKTIEGFSLLHMSGIGWYGEFGNLQFMPTTGAREFDRNAAAAPFTHDRETAHAGYYRVALPRYGVEAELTAARTAGVLRFTYPTGETARVKLDLGRRIGQKNRWLTQGHQHVDVASPTSLEGWAHCPHEDGGWGRGDGGVDYTVYFCAVFSAPFSSVGAVDRTTPLGDGRAAYEGTNLVFDAMFGHLAAPLVVKVGVSFTSVADARANLARDVGPKSFAEVRRAAAALWERELAGVAVSGGSAEDHVKFATALYHAFLDPREIGKGEGFTRRTVFSGWDVFRSEMPLLTLLRPDVVTDTISSMMETVTSGKRQTLPRWDIFGCPSGCMIGAPIVSVMADAWTKGIRDFDAPKALELACTTLAREGNDRTRGLHPSGSLSQTLEYAYADWCCARLAEGLGHTALAAQYDAYAQAYTNCWSSEAGWMRSRNPDGTWWPWKGREIENQGTVESSPWQQGWFVPHDPEGLVRLMGGRARFTQELETFFAATRPDFRWSPGYNHPNEPCHTLPLLFAYSDKPELVGTWTRRICDKAYGTGPFGLCGNDDVGQMSAWYVLSAIGLQTLCPGDGRWHLTTPVFPEVRLGKLVIRAPHARERTDLRGATLNGRTLDRPWITHAEVLAGGVLAFK